MTCHIAKQPKRNGIVLFQDNVPPSSQAGGSGKPMLDAYEVIRNSNSCMCDLSRSSVSAEVNQPHPVLKTAVPTIAMEEDLVSLKLFSLS